MTIPAFNDWHYDSVLRVYGCTIPQEFWPSFQVVADKSLKSRGGYLSLTIDLPKRPRSTGPGSASNHLHGHCQQLTMVFDMSIDRVKMYIKIRAALEMGYPAEMINGIAIPQSEALATVEEESKLIEMAHIVASERGVALIEEPGND
ncbi:hypothetical protein M0R72_18545 [Candidatus Pacearchaeota archaeon]|jgi:hypothetical protein|nr:hypothetical protein [Candidatus Pacearchaeota archaeon]